tara:strand:+ start:221 stop:685 length:465 start_codon:yes stop_codon:yes gene_type:complete
MTHIKKILEQHKRVETVKAEMKANNVKTTPKATQIIVKPEERSKYTVWTALISRMNKGGAPNEAFYNLHPEMRWELWSKGIKPEGSKLKKATKAKPQTLRNNGQPKKDRQVTFSITANQRSTFHALAKRNNLKTIELFNKLLTEKGRKEIAKLK